MKTLLKYFNNYKMRAILAPLFKMLEAIFELLVPLVMAALIDVGIANNDTDYVIKMALLMVGLGVIGLVCSLTAQYFSAKTAMGIARELRYDLFTSIQKLRFSQIDEVGTSTLITRLTTDLNLVKGGINMFLRLFLRSPFIVFGACIMAAVVTLKSVPIFLLVLALVGTVVFVITLYTLPKHLANQAKFDGLTKKTRSNLTGVRVVRAFNKQEDEKEEYNERSRDLAFYQIKIGNFYAALNPITYVLINLGIILILMKGGRLVNTGVLSQGEVYALINYVSQILVELIKLANLIVQETKAMACMYRIEEIMLLSQNTVKEDEALLNPELDESKPVLVFDNVSFKYPGSKNYALTDINFTLNKGETLGIIGGTASGKSTLVNLIPGFYKIDKGDVLFEGASVDKCVNKEILGRIGIVPQYVSLLSGSIRNNVMMGVSDEADTDEMLKEALEISVSDEFVYGKTDGADYKLNLGATNLSGGQRKRITIARALAKNPDLLILDNAAAALDAKTGAELFENLSKKDMTVINVCERVSMVKNSDKILVLDDGKMVGFGTHEELLTNCDIYKEIAELEERGVK